MMSTAVTFGEIMLRLSAPACKRFAQATSFDAVYGGGEANVAESLANYGLDARFVTLLPDNPLGDACVRQLRGFGVDTSHIVRKAGRIG
ncbi:MAG: PfkB family carbohydrate kinase, partial [Planctomycetota bacterium]